MFTLYCMCTTNVYKIVYENFQIWKIMMMWKRRLILTHLTVLVFRHIVVCIGSMRLQARVYQDKQAENLDAWYCRIGFLYDILNFVNLHTAYTLSNSWHYFTPITFTPIIFIKNRWKICNFPLIMYLQKCMRLIIPWRVDGTCWTYW